MNADNTLGLSEGNTYDNVLISVVIPAFNRAQDLHRSIVSIINQTYQLFEIVVVDDGSNDDLASVCASFHDSRIRFYKNNTHKNANVARNKGIYEAKGVFIAMLDSDDEFLQNHLERRLIKIQEQDCDGIFGSAYVRYGKNEILHLSRSPYQGEKMIDYLLSDGFAPSPSYFIKKTAAMDILWDESLERHQDFDFTIRFSDKYKLFCDFEPTILIHWENEEKKDYRLDSCIEFISRQVNSISGRNYCNYHRNMYLRISDYEKKKYIKHYAQESYRYIFLVSFSEFLIVHEKLKNFKLLLLIKFIFLHFKFFLIRRLGITSQ